jgi:NADH-quinone oxidoreductase subunit G
MFLTETAAIADLVLPVANAYEKGGTYTNTCGDAANAEEGWRVFGRAQ